MLVFSSTFFSSKSAPKVQSSTDDKIYLIKILYYLIVFQTQEELPNVKITLKYVINYIFIYYSVISKVMIETFEMLIFFKMNI